MDKYEQQAEQVNYINDEEPITQEEIEEAKVIMAKLHPMMTTPYHKVLPTVGKCFKCCFCCGSNREERMDEMKALLKEEREEHDKKINEVFNEYDVKFEGLGPDQYDGSNSKKMTDEEIAEQDPYNNLGYGWMAYYQTLHIFTWLFLVFSAIMLPAFYFYASPAGLKLVTHGYYNSVFMMGNFGFNKAVCVSSYVSLAGSANAGLQCEVGTMSQIVHAGIIRDNVDYTWDNIAYGYCGDANGAVGTKEPEQVPYGTQECTDSFLNYESLYSDFSSKCFNNNICEFRIHDYIVSSNSTATAAETTACTTGTAKVYMQYSCTESVPNLNKKRQAGLVVSALTCVCGILFLSVIFYLKKTAGLDFQMWDLQTLTASDFTIEVTITEPMWDKFNVELGKHAELPKGGAAPDHTSIKLPVVTFEAYLEHVLCKKLNALPKIHDDIEVRVANITFGFNNAEMLDLLTQRGTLLTKGQLEKVPDLNDKIDRLCKDQKTELIRPVAAFITFEQQEGKERALAYFKDEKEIDEDNEAQADSERASRQHLIDQAAQEQILGNALRVKQAPEPSEILWHNRHVTVQSQNKRKVGVFILCLIFLVAMFALFSWMKASSIKNMWRYPSTTNCAAVSSTFTDSEGTVDMALYQEYANLDKNLTITKQGTGIYQCFCDAYKSDPGVGYTNSDDLCYIFASQKFGGYAISQSITVAITIVNTIIRTLCIMLIKMVGYHTETGEIAAITLTIFIATFFNTAILLLLADADLSQVTIFSWIPIRGPFPDLTEQWYIVVAPSLIMTMAINSVYAYIDFGISFGTLVLFRCLDQGFSTYLCCKKEKTTKCKTIQAYVNTYSGPQHVMSYRYSAILVTTWITLMYGVALPIMFPIAAFTFFNYYIVDRFLVAYYFQRPPIYDDKLNKLALESMKFAPLLMFFFGWWTLGNMQVFSDTIVPLVNSAVPLTTDHNVEPQGNQSLPLFIMGCLLFIGLVVTSCCTPCLKKMHLVADDEIELVDENVGSYYECVSVGERKRWLAQEVHANRTLGVSSMGFATSDKLRTANGRWRVIKNAPNYEILSNIKYCQAFQFTPIDMCDTQEEQEISDMITRVLYLGYAKPGFQEFDFKRVLNKKGSRRAQLAKEKLKQMKQNKLAKQDEDTFDVDNKA